MKLSIWQQFSSNHSGSFSVVGRFETEDEARAAAEKLTAIVKRIDEWHENSTNAIWYSQQTQAHRSSLTPIEEAIRQEYGIEWDHQAVDWYGMHTPVHQFRHVVFFSSGDSWSTPTPIVNLLKRFGGETAQSTSYEEMVFDSIYVILACSFDNETVAEATRALIAPFTQISDMDNSPKPPWGMQDGAPVYLGQGSVERDGTHLRLEYEFSSIMMGLFAVIEWLQGRGAWDIDYRFETRVTPHDDEF